MILLVSSGLMPESLNPKRRCRTKPVRYFHSFRAFAVSVAYVLNLPLLHLPFATFKALQFADECQNLSGQ